MTCEYKRRRKRRWHGRETQARIPRSRQKGCLFIWRRRRRRRRGGVHIGERHTRSAQEGKGRLRGADSVDSAMTREPGNFGSTNREKPRNKSIMIIMGSKGARGKKKQSLKEKQKRLHAHIDRAKSPRRRLIMEHRASRRAESRPVS